MSRKSKTTFYCLMLVIMVLSLASIACDDAGDISGDLPRIGDAMKIGEKLEQTACVAQGGTWSTRTNTCK